MRHGSIAGLPHRGTTRLNLPLPLTHSWALSEQRQRFDLGQVFDEPGDLFADPEFQRTRFTAEVAGLWECDLTNNALTWTAGVFDLFGLPRDAVVKRDEVTALYAEPSRAAMERLRAHAIKHRRGFTLDAEIVPVRGRRRWMRLIAAPICVGGRAVRLHGLKLDLGPAA
jgi:PAS domain-containing protein